MSITIADGTGVDPMDAEVDRAPAERVTDAARMTALETALTEALDEFEDALGYVPEWAMEKWGYRAKVARLRDVAKGGTSSAEPAQNVKDEEAQR